MTNEASEQRYAYISTSACGHVNFACVDDPKHRADTGKQVANAVRRGEIIEHVTVEEARIRLKLCDCWKKERALATAARKAQGSLL